MTDIFAELDADAARARVDSAPTDSESSTIGRLGAELGQIEDRLEKWGAVAKQLEERRNEIQFKLLVDAMDAVNQDKMGLPQFNADIEVVDWFRAALPNPDNAKTREEADQMALLRAEGLAWLADNGHDDVISTVLKVTMPKGSLPTARIMARTLMQLFDVNATVDSRLAWLHEAEIEEGQQSPGLLGWLATRNEPGIDPGSASIDEGVHWATLTSLVKDLVTKQKINPEELPKEALGATVGRKAVIKKRKAKK